MPRAVAQADLWVLTLDHAVRLSNQLGRPDVAASLSSKFGTVSSDATIAIADSDTSQLSGVELGLVRDAFNLRSSEERAFYQHVLQVLGYYRSNVDGAWGPGTAGAFSLYFAEQKSVHQVARIEGATSANELLNKLAGHYDMLEGMGDMQESE